MFPNVEVRHLYAIVVLAEELSFTRTANLLHITQPALSKLVTDFEEEHSFSIFTRDKRRGVELTDAGRVFVAEARSALMHTERAIHLARAACEGADKVLTIGHSPYANPMWIAAILSIRLPLFPRLRIQTTGRLFSTELVRGVIAGELDLALVTTPPSDAQITAVPFDRAPLYALLPSNHRAAHQDAVSLRDLANDEWILLGPRVHPLVHAAILSAAKCAGFTPRHAHDVLDSYQAVHLVGEHLGVAILTKPTASAYRVDGVVAKPVADEALWVDTCVVMRADDDSRMVNELVRLFLRKYGFKPFQPKQMTLPLPA